MFKLKHVPPEQATGQAKEAYGIFPKGMEPPRPFLLMSVSPGLLAQGAARLKHYMNHPNLSSQLMAATRYMAARIFDYQACIEFNGGRLSQMGATEADLEALVGDLDKSPLEENEIVILKLVDKVLRAPKTVTQQDVDVCRDAGWTDADILDICMQGSIMQATGRLMDAFSS